MAEVEAPSDGTHPLRLAQTIRLPFWVSVAGFVAIAIVAAILLGRPRMEQTIPPVVTDYQRALAAEMAQNVRRGLNEGVADVAQMAAAIDASRTSGSGTVDVFADALRDTHDRYDEIAVLDANGKVIFGGRSGTRPLDAGPGVPGIAPLAELDNPRRPLIEQFAPLADGGLVVARYDPEFLKFALSAAGPGDAWLIDGKGRIVSSTTGYLPYSRLPTDALREGAARASRGSTGASAPSVGLDGSVVAWAPVTGEGPGGQLGVSVVSNRDVGSLSLPATDARREGLVVAVLIAIFTVLVFSWLWIVVMVPASRLRDEAERVARGDFSSPVEILRYDEIGLISRATDRLRILLVGARVAGTPARQVRPQHSVLRKVSVALLTLIAFAAFTALLAAITTVDGTAPVGEPVQPRKTTSTLPVTAESPKPQIALEATSCIQRAEAVEYSAKLSHGQPTPLGARIAVSFRDRSGFEFGSSEATVSVPAGEGVRVTVSAFTPDDLSDTGATCTVTALGTFDR